MYHNRSDQDQKRDLLRRFILTSALVPLTSELATSGYGYKISNTELKIVKQFSDDIGMEFGLEKCAKASFKKGSLASIGNRNYR